jgi:apolipoprotein N-acyltransferase
MPIGRLKCVLVVALATLVAPLAAVAQVPNDNVTTAPLAAYAPVMGMPLLLLLAVVLAGVAAYRLRRAAGPAIAALGFVAALTVLASLGYATMVMTILPVQGAQCGVPTTQPFNPMGGTTLVSHCPNAIRIISIHLETSCMFGMGLNPCQVNQILVNNESCSLPLCTVD